MLIMHHHSVWKGSSETDHTDELHTSVYMGIKTAYCGFSFTIFILTMWFTLYEFALFLQPYVAAEYHTPLSLFQLSSTLYTSLFLSFQVDESCKCAISLPTPIPLRPLLSKALRCSRHLCFSSHFFSSLIKKKVRGLFSKAFFLREGSKHNRAKQSKISP